MRGRGRPELPPGRERSVKMTVNLTPAEYMDYRARAARSGTPLARYLREMIAIGVRSTRT